jgi:hypothetical protein
MNGRRASIYCKAVYDKDGKLSVTGVIGPLPSGNSLGSCGQIDMEFAHRNLNDDDQRYVGELIKPEDISFAKGWNREKWLDFLDVWHKYHLNDMKAGTPKQEEAIKKFRAENKISGWAYDKEREHLDKIGLLIDDGYVYGTAWLKESVPREVVAFLASLPDADKQPAWV